MLFILKSHVSHHCHHTSSASSIYILSTSSEISPLYDLAALQHLAALLLRFKTPSPTHLIPAHRVWQPPGTTRQKMQQNAFFNSKLIPSKTLHHLRYISKICQFKTCQNTFKTQTHTLSPSLCALDLSVVFIPFQFDAPIYHVLPGSCVAVPFTWHLPPRIHQFLSSFLWSLLFLHGLMKVSQAGVKSLVLWQKPTLKHTICKQHEPRRKAQLQT